MPAAVTKAASTLSVNSSNDSDNAAMTGVYANASIMQLIMALLGREVVVRTKDQRIFKGLLDSISQEFEVALVMAHEVIGEEAIDALPRQKDMISTLVFKYSEIVSLQGDAKLDKPNLTGFACDKDYSKDEEVPRSLNGAPTGDDVDERWNRIEEWTPDEGDEHHNHHQQHIDGASWSVDEMFSRNVNLGVESTYVEEMVQYSNAEIGDASDASRRRAAAIAAEIESDPRSRRAQMLENDDEERDIVNSGHGGYRGGRGGGRGGGGRGMARGGGRGGTRGGATAQRPPREDGFNEWANRRQQTQPTSVTPIVKSPATQPAPLLAAPVQSPVRHTTPMPSNDVRQIQQQQNAGGRASTSQPPITPNHLTGGTQPRTPRASTGDQLKQFHQDFKLSMPAATPLNTVNTSAEGGGGGVAPPNAWPHKPTSTVPPANMSVPPPLMPPTTSSGTTVETNVEPTTSAHTVPPLPGTPPRPSNDQHESTPTSQSFKFNVDAAVFTPKTVTSPSISADVTQPIYEQQPQQPQQHQLQQMQQHQMMPQQPIFAQQPPPQQIMNAQPLHVTTVPPAGMQQAQQPQMMQQQPGGQQFVAMQPLQQLPPQFIQQQQQVTAAQVMQAQQQQRVMQAPPPYMHPMQQQQQPQRLLQQRPQQPTSTHLVTGQPLMAAGATTNATPMLVMSAPQGGQPTFLPQGGQFVQQFYQQQPMAGGSPAAGVTYMTRGAAMSQPPPPSSAGEPQQQFVYPGPPPPQFNQAMPMSNSSSPAPFAKQYVNSIMQNVAVMTSAQPPPQSLIANGGNSGGGSDSAHPSQPPTPGPIMMAAPSPGMYSPHPMQAGLQQGQYVVVQQPQQFQGQPPQQQIIMQQQTPHEAIMQQQMMMQQQRMSTSQFMASPPSGPPPQQHRSSVGNINGGQQ